MSLMCERARIWSSLRVDGELSELESALLESHLGRCDSCRTFARGAETVAVTLASARLERPVLRLVVPRRRASRRALQTAAAATCMLAAATVAGFVGIVGHGGSARAAKPVAMVSALDTPNELRQLRRPGLIERVRAIPRNRQEVGESY